MINKYKNSYFGQSGIIIGAGPSICTYNNIQEVCKKFTTIGINAAYAFVIPDFLVFQDPWIWINKKDQIKEINTTPLTNYNDRLTDDKDVIYLKSTKESKLPDDDQFFVSANSGILALLWAYYIGLKSIYLLGIDLVEEDIKNNYVHAHTEYPEDRRKRTKVERNQIFIDSFIYWINILEDKGIKIYSCSERSSLNRRIKFTKKLLVRG